MSKPRKRRKASMIQKSKRIYLDGYGSDQIITTTALNNDIKFYSVSNTGNASAISYIDWNTASISFDPPVNKWMDKYEKAYNNVTPFAEDHLSIISIKKDDTIKYITDV
jgi:hypothetical protein